MKQTHYQQAKAELKQLAAQVKRSHPTDKPAQREAINNMADNLSREFWRHYSEKQTARLTNCLHSFAADLHP